MIQPKISLHSASHVIVASIFTSTISDRFGVFHIRGIFGLGRAAASGGSSNARKTSLRVPADLAGVRSVVSEGRRSLRCTGWRSKSEIPAQGLFMCGAAVSEPPRRVENSRVSCIQTPEKEDCFDAESSKNFSAKCEASCHVGTSKRPQLVLDALTYEEPHRAILNRDVWRCPNWGARKNQTHDIQSRRLLEDETEETLIKLCTY